MNRATVVQGAHGLYYVQKARGRMPWSIYRQDGRARRLHTVWRGLPTKRMAMAVVADYVRIETTGPLA